MSQKSRLPPASGLLNTKYGVETVTYDRIYKLILNGRLPAVQVAGKYEIDLDQAAEVLGLTEPADA
jgi:hypothetical protein